MEKIITAIANLNSGKTKAKAKKFITSLGNEFQLGLITAHSGSNDKLISAVNNSEIMTQSEKTKFLADIS